jgi:hypothetical protein
MDQARIAEIALRIEHRHSDDTWGEMREERSHHDSADHDPERSWGVRRLFRCTSCSETVTVITGEEEGGAPLR